MGVWSSKAGRGLRRPLRGQRSCVTGCDAQLVPLLTSTLPPPLNFAEAHLHLSPEGHGVEEMAGLNTVQLCSSRCGHLQLYPSYITHKTSCRFQALAEFAGPCCSTWPFLCSLTTHIHCYSCNYFHIKYRNYDAKHNFFSS